MSKRTGLRPNRSEASDGKVAGCHDPKIGPNGKKIAAESLNSDGTDFE